MVSLAIPREKVKTLERTNKTDKRNLYLLEEGGKFVTGVVVNGFLELLILKVKKPKS